jgi:hypothetical protein
MVSTNRNHGPTTTQGPTAAPTEGDRRSNGARIRPWVNWTLALLTAPASVVVVLIGLGALMSYAACTDRACRDWGIGGIWLEVLWFGPPVVAALTIFVSFFTAKRRYGIVVPLCGWALLAADVGLLALFSQP